MTRPIRSTEVVDSSQHAANQDDVLSSLAQHVIEYAGWMKVSVMFEDGVLTVDCDSDSSDYRLVYDVKNRREIYGRLKTLGITLSVLETIHSLTGNEGGRHE